MRIIYVSTKSDTTLSGIFTGIHMSGSHLIWLHQAFLAQKGEHQISNPGVADTEFWEGASFP
jgi:hypothetical protein